jgi:hypothetical protein
MPSLTLIQDLSTNKELEAGFSITMRTQSRLKATPHPVDVQRSLVSLDCRSTLRGFKYDLTDGGAGPDRNMQAREPGSITRVSLVRPRRLRLQLAAPLRDARRR